MQTSLVTRLIGGNIAVAKFSMTKVKFQNQWLRHFAPDLTKEQYEKYVKDQFIWHVFSWKLITPPNLLVGDAARNAYNVEEKIECIYCDMFGSDGVTDQKTLRNDTAEKIDAQFSELYVVFQNYSWTYIKTHEGDTCGPYFIKNVK